MASSDEPTMSRRRGNAESRNEQSNADVHQNGPVSVKTEEPSQQSSASSSPALTASQTTAILQIWAPTLLLIFGGCCSNVYTLEALIHTSPTSGSLLTGLQFLLVALATAPRHLSFSRGWRNLYLRERNIPLRKWLVYTAYFLSINILNNMAFKYRISVPLHIILRSAGPVMTMAVGRFWGGKRYPPHKIVAVLLLFAGVVMAAFSDAWAKQAPVAQPQVASQKTSASSQAPGFALLASALLLSALMGLYTDDMYATHGRSTSVAAETLFYSHAMSLPYFASQARPLMHELGLVTATALTGFEQDISGKNSTSLTKWSSWMPFVAAPDSSSMSHLLLLPVSLVLRTPRPIALLALNAGTQLLCIIGVNRLSAQSSSLTVGIVLNIRKLASLLLSICLFGNSLPMGVLVGAAIVFLGGGLYALPASATGAFSSDTRQTEKKKV